MSHADLLRWGYLPCEAHPEPAWGKMLQDSMDEAIEVFDALLYSAVYRALDGMPEPVGIGLSGGLDSSLICHYSRKAKRDLVAVHCDVGKGEEPIASYVARKCGIRQYSKIAAPFDGPDDRVYQHVYTSDPAAGATLKLCEALAAKGCRSMLTGLGADEMLAAYGRQLRHVGKPMVDYYREHEVFTREECNEIFPGVVTTLFPACSHPDQLSAMGWLDLQTYGAACVEMTETLATEVAGISLLEHPFCDPKVVQFLASLPAEYKLPGEGKYIEKALAERIFGHDFAWRVKAGFGPAIMPWLRENLWQVREACLHRPFYESVRMPETPMEAKRVWTLYCYTRCFG